MDRRPSPITAEAVAPVTARPAMTTIANVDLISTGTYELASGTTTFTEDDLADAVAAQDDPAVKAPRIKLGHVDPRFDGQPTLGTVQNMRLSANGQTVTGDLVGVPTWLADIMPSAYPNRSIEGDFDVTVGFEGTMGGTTATGKTYRLVLSALALLGTALPGVEVLDDLPMLFSADALDQGGVQGGATFEAMKVKAATNRPVHASINVEDVRRAYYEAIEGDPDSWAYWIRAMYLDPNELIVDKGDGDAALLKIPFTVDSSGTVEFGDAEEVKVEYVAAGGKVAAAGRRATVYANRDDSRPDPEEDTMDYAAELRSTLGLEPEATDEEVQAAIAERKAAEEAAPSETDPPADPVEPNPDPAAAPSPEDAPAEAAPANEPGSTDPTPPADVAASGTVTVDAQAWEDTQRMAAAGAAARDEQITAGRERLLDDAVKAGKIPPSRKDHWRKMHKADPKGAEQTLASLEANTIPVDPIGEAGGEVAASAEAYPPDWFPEANRNGAAERPFMTKE